MANRFNDLISEVASLIELPPGSGRFAVDNMRGQMDTVWPFQKEVLENVLLETKPLRATLEPNDEYSDSETDGIADFIQAHLRDVVFDVPENEKQIQNALETLFVGRGYGKGTDFDREAGKVEFSGKEYTPDFCMRKHSFAIEVKLLKDPKYQSRIVEEVSANITAYSKKYSNQLFVVYDLGCIQNITQFKSDIEQYDGVRVVVVKH